MGGWCWTLTATTCRWAVPGGRRDGAGTQDLRGLGRGLAATRGRPDPWAVRRAAEQHAQVRGVPDPARAVGVEATLLEGDLAESVRAQGAARPPDRVWPTPDTTGATATFRPGKPDEALTFCLAVELGHPLACQLSSPVTHRHHELLAVLSLVSLHGHVPDGRERTAPGHHPKVDHLVESLGAVGNVIIAATTHQLLCGSIRRRGLPGGRGSRVGAAPRAWRAPAGGPARGRCPSPPRPPPGSGASPSPARSGGATLAAGAPAGRPAPAPRPGGRPPRRPARRGRPPACPPASPAAPPRHRRSGHLAR